MKRGEMQTIRKAQGSVNQPHPPASYNANFPTDIAQHHHNLFFILGFSSMILLFLIFLH